jgi:hypothetical protein
MLMRLIYTSLVFFISINCFSQEERADLIGNKIKLVKKTIYTYEDSSNKAFIQNFYSKAGDDSLEIYNGDTTFRFIPTIENGRVSKLVRLDSESREDELHMYKYNKNGSYSIEVIAQGAGQILLAKYDKNNMLMEETIDASYTLVYVRKANGKTEKILSKQDGKTETIAVFYFDKIGLPIRGEGTTEGGKRIYFKYNDKKLVSEIKTVGKNDDNKEETEIILLEYEFYENPN